mgnify:FL=1
MAGCAYRFTQRHSDHTSYKKYKDVFDERRRITRFRISPRVLMYIADTSSLTDAELDSA